MSSPDPSLTIAQALGRLLREVVLGAPERNAFVLNPNDPGLLRALDGLRAESASAQPGGRSSIAAHTHHVYYGLSLMNRWSRGEENPFADANFAASWKRQRVSAEEWDRLRAMLRTEAEAWITEAERPRERDRLTLTATLSSVVHLAYHLGAIRQLDASAGGPKATD